MEHSEEVVHTHTLDYYMAIKKDETIPNTTTWTDLECILLSKISQLRKKITYFTHMWSENMTKNNK